MCVLGWAGGRGGGVKIEWISGVGMWDPVEQYRTGRGVEIGKRKKRKRKRKERKRLYWPGDSSQSITFTADEDQTGGQYGA